MAKSNSLLISFPFFVDYDINMKSHKIRFYFLFSKTLLKPKITREHFITKGLLHYKLNQKFS